MKPFVIFFAAIFLLTIYSCKKKGIDVDYSVLEVHDDVNLQKIIFLNDNVGYTCGGNKSENGVIYKTTDAGATWQKQYSNNTLCVYDIKFVNDTIGYACGENMLLLKTIDGGNHWITQSPNQPLQGYEGTLHSIFCFDANIVYVAGGKNYQTGLTYKTYNGGAEWIYNTFDTEFRSVWFTSKLTGYYAGYGAMMQTTDSATNFHPLTINGDFYVSLYFTDSQTAFACGYNGGIYKTTDGGNSWNNQLSNNNSIVSSRHFNNIQFENGNKGYAVGSNGLIIFTDSGTDWNQIKKIDDSNLFSVCVRGSKIYISSEGGKIYRLNR